MSAFMEISYTVFNYIIAGVPSEKMHAGRMNKSKQIFKMISIWRRFLKKVYKYFKS